jgi:hypothetical protein
LAEEEQEEKNWFTAVMLSLFFAGLGFAYIGHYKRFALGILTVFILGFLTITGLQITGISPNTEAGRFAIFIIEFSFWAYLAYLTKRVCEEKKAKRPIKDTFNFWEIKKGKEKNKETGKEKTGLSATGLTASAAIAMIIYFLFGPIAALIAFATMLAIAHIGSI